MHAFYTLCAAALVAPALASGSAFSSQKVFAIPPVPVNGTSELSFEVGKGALDGVYANFFNATTYQWWYYGVVAKDLSSAVSLEFFANAPAGTGSTEAPFNMVQFTALLPNGTLYQNIMPGSMFTITSEGQGTSGFMNESGYSWTGSRDNSRFVVDIDVPYAGLKGKMDMRSIGPAHSVCGPPTEGAGLALHGSRLAWLNPVPDADTHASFTLGDLSFTIDGSGYSDIDWSDESYYSHLTQWYWGHARVGPYSIVWFDYVDTTGKEHVSGYASKYGEVVSSKCSGIAVRPTGPNSTYTTYPPIDGQPEPTGFHIDFDLGEEGKMDVYINSTAVAFTVPGSYTRWIGSVAGKVNGKAMKGYGLYEWQRAGLVGSNGS